MDLYPFIDLYLVAFYFFLLQQLHWESDRDQSTKQGGAGDNPGCPACHYKPHHVCTGWGQPLCVAAAWYKRSWWQMLPSEEKARRSHKDSIADVFVLRVTQGPQPDFLDTRALGPACRLGYVDTCDLDLVGMRVTAWMSENSFGLGQIPLYHLQSLMVQLSILLPQSCDMNCYTSEPAAAWQSHHLIRHETPEQKEGGGKRGYDFLLLFCQHETKDDSFFDTPLHL